MSAGPAALLRAVLAEVVGAAVTPGEVVYPFASARDAFDPTGEATRELGRTLQERGALRGRGSGVAGNCWRVDPARVSADLLGPPDPATRGAAQRFLATLPTGPSLGGQPF